MRTLILPDWFDPDHVYKCSAILREKDKQTIRICDLQFDEGQPYIVVEWQMTHDGEIPAIRIPLNPSYLLPAKIPDGDWCYSGVTLDIPQ